MKKFKKIISLVDLIGSYKKQFYVACILIFICGLFNMFYGYLNGAAVEEITKLHVNKALLYLGLYFIVEVFFEGFIQMIATANLEKVESKLTRTLSFEGYKKALLLPAGTYEKVSSGEIINRINSDADTVCFIFGRLLKIVIDLFVTIILFFYIMYNSWVIALEIVVVVILLGLVLKKYTPLMEQAHKERKKEGDKMSSLTNESIRGIREIKSLGIRKNLITNAKEIVKMIYEKSVVETNTYVRFNLISKVLRAILEVGTFVSCIFLMYFGKVSLGFFIAMTYYIYRYTYLMETISDFAKEYNRASVSLDRICELLENKLSCDDTFGNVKLENCEGIIKFNNVYFGYPNEKQLLKKFSVTLAPGKKIAIVGKSGQGKSTLFNLLTRLFDVNKGSITLDSINLKDLDEDSLRNNISIIRQEPFVFNRTIKDNFKILNPNITMKEIKKYCKLAHIDNYINSLPRGYNTLLGEGGVNLSGGQKQRLAIARSLSKNSKVLMFDEATSALDNESQDYIKKTIDNLVQDHTVIIVAHRLSTIVDADIIHVVDGGKIVATGTHYELLEKNEIYKNLYLNENL